MLKVRLLNCNLEWIKGKEGEEIEPISEKAKIGVTFEKTPRLSGSMPPDRQEEDRGFNEGMGGAGEKEREKVS